MEVLKQEENQEALQDLSDIVDLSEDETFEILDNYIDQIKQLRKSYERMQDENSNLKDKIDTQKREMFILEKSNNELRSRSLMLQNEIFATKNVQKKIG